MTSVGCGFSRMTYSPSLRTVVRVAGARNGWTASVHVRQAVSMIVERTDCTVDEAFGVLLDRAARLDQSIEMTARDVVDGEVHFDSNFPRTIQRVDTAEPWTTMRVGVKLTMTWSSSSWSCMAASTPPQQSGDAMRYLGRLEASLRRRGRFPRAMRADLADSSTRSASSCVSWTIGIIRCTRSASLR